LRSFAYLVDTFRITTLKTYATTDAGKKSGPQSAGRGLPMLKAERWMVPAAELARIEEHKLKPACGKQVCARQDS